MSPPTYKPKTKFMQLAIAEAKRAPPTPLRPNLTEAEIEEQIRQRAYELYQGRGGVDRNAADDWLKARKEY
jgi:hypothetical protein